eukprot:6486792-Ditylum_brightwellii.AAC.1
MAYYKDNLSKLPDVNVTGRSYYSYYHYLDIPPLSLTHETTTTDAIPNFYFLRFRGLGYASTIYHDNEIMARTE